MYLPHFGLRELPFSLTPDVDFTYLAQPYQAALNVLLLALEGGEGFIKVTGEVGTGKTLLCRTLLQRLPDHMVSAYVPNPRLSPPAMLRALSSDLDLPVNPKGDEHGLYCAVEAQLLALAQRDQRVVLCIDEAQALPSATLESLRLLSNIETGKHKLIQIVLFGQPELDDKLAQRSLRSLASRMSFSARLSPLSLADFESYLRHRMSVAGWRGPDVFSAGARYFLWLGSAGVPRRANVLAHKCLLLAFGRGHHRVDARMAWGALQDDKGWLRTAWPVLATLLGRRSNGVAT
ncbi:MAG: AAA family ATPase [Burkholderiales bacterium]|nr:AAA family ATPase [Burkholderiales bacterium]